MFLISSSIYASGKGVHRKYGISLVQFEQEQFTTP